MQCEQSCRKETSSSAFLVSKQKACLYDVPVKITSSFLFTPTFVLHPSSDNKSGEKL